MPTYKEEKIREAEKKHLVPVDVDGETGGISFPKEVKDNLVLNDEESEAANGTRLHSLRAMEALVFSGILNKQELLTVLKSLAEYQFMKASSTRRPVQQEKTVEDYLEELDGVPESGES